MAAEVRTDKNNNRGGAARGGFSLAFVLVIALAGMALLGASFMLFENFSHRSFRSMGGVEEMNAMDDAIEFTRLELAELMLSSPNIPRAVFKSVSGDRIREPRNLLVADPNNLSEPWKLNGGNIRRLNTTAHEDVTLEIEVFDVLYTSADVDNSISAAELAALPSAIVITPASASANESYAASVGVAGVDEYNNLWVLIDTHDGNAPVLSNAGVYMIRATLTRPDGHGRITEVVQAIKKDL